MKIRLLFLILLTTVIGNIYSQEAAITELTEGLVIDNGVIYGRNNFVNDPQAVDIINDLFKSPYPGMISGKTPEGENAVWAEITADENGYFNSEKLRFGALYIEYESPEDKIMLLNASGHTMVFINGEPREGDHYDFNFSVHPVLIKKGINQLYFTNGRYPRIKVSLEKPGSRILIKKKDLTLPDLIIEEPGFKWAGVTIVNAIEKYTTGLKIRCTVKDIQMTTELPGIEKLTSRRMNFRIPVPEGLEPGEQEVKIELLSRGNNLYDSNVFGIKCKNFALNHDRTFISNIDGSVQYYSVTPSASPAEGGQALFLSVHGAGVQARNQAWTYDAKDWGHIVAPTNRGPFGFAWEDWGRLDALEVLNEGRKLFETSPEKTYLTGHSMGGHGTWYLGATYPDKFAAIAPCAGYPDLLNYASGGPGMKENGNMKQMFDRAGNTSRTLKIARNYMHHGVYVYHGDSDPTVSVEQARRMRQVLGEFHPDFTYYEYPGGTHWYGDISMDWPPIFDFFKLHSIPSIAAVKKLEFYTASPGVSAYSHWIAIHQQINPFEISSVKARISNDSSQLTIDTDNISTMAIKTGIPALKYPLSIVIDNQNLKIAAPDTNEYHFLKFDNEEWAHSLKPAAEQKGPHRYGGFKDAFKENMLFVYGTTGTKEENRWNYLKARFDAETFSYRGNGSVELISDRQFRAGNFKGRNIIIYGNADNNRAWKLLLGESPVQVQNNKLIIGDKTITGDDIACYFIRPLKGSVNNSVGVIAGTGLKGMRAAYPNQYFIAGSSFPDLTVFRMPESGEEYKAVECAGFFGNDWSVGNGDFVWNKK
ncbi:MAG: prolyl oligopeptidase family serine peptidase [Bacteroidales bacterium]|nr:prolyl oligopeptidase family serine peptidase [Bacteroidales bacterium]